MALRAITILSIALAATVWARAADDPVHSSACEQALQRMHDEEQRILGSGRRGATPALHQAQSQVAQHCLHERDLAQPRPLRERFATPPIEVPSIAMPRPPVPQPSPALSAPAPTVPAPPALVTVTSCDATGCWTSNGTYLNRVGGALAGPSGVCTATASVLSCH